METLQNNINLLWIVIAAALVMFMQAGFTALESGLTRSKNSINVAMKNITDFAVAVAIFFLFGYAIMFGEGNAFMGWQGFALSGFDTPNDYASFLFQATFAGTAATIVSGAVAERMRFSAYVLISIAVTALIYPISGHWIWGAGGWLAERKMVDFAGSTVVHSLGAWVGLAGAIVLGPRLNRWQDGKPTKMHSSNLVFAVIGTIILFFGWFGFNGGSTLEVNDQIPLIIVNTMLSGAASGISCIILSALTNNGRVELEKFINGIIGGLVAITAGCATLNPVGAICIGFAGGLVVFFAELFVLHILKADDPVNVVAAHGFAGAWGTIALALFAPVDNLPLESRSAQLGVQILGVLAVAAWGLGTGFLIFGILKVFDFLRVPPEAERIGLNIFEHGASSELNATIETADSIIKAYHGQGSSDLTQRLKVEHGSDAGEVAHAFNQLLSAFHDAIADIKQAATEVNASAGHMRKASEHVQSDAQSSQEIGAALSEAMAEIFKLTDETQRQARSCAKLASDTYQAAQDGHSVVQKTLNSIGILDKTVKASVHTVSELVEKTNSVANILETINSISEQTNLLALNAAIEAARAGEAGRGFAVVADEVRNLSNKTHQATQDIMLILQELKTLSERAQTNMTDCMDQAALGKTEAQESDQTLDSIEDLAHQAILQIETVDAQATAQLSASQSAQELVHQLNEFRSRTLSHSMTVAETSEQLAGLADGLQHSLSGFKVKSMVNKAADQNRKNKAA